MLSRECCAVLWLLQCYLCSQVIFYFLLPVVYVIMATGDLAAGRIVMLWLVIVALNGLEVYIGFVTFSVMLYKMKSAGIASVFACVDY